MELVVPEDGNQVESMVSIVIDSSSHPIIYEDEEENSEADDTSVASAESVQTGSPANGGKKPLRTEEEDYDTDLEVEADRSDFDASGSLVYLETSRSLGVVPASYVVRHIREERLEMRHHGLGAMGAKALSIPLVSNTSVVVLDLEDNWIEGDGARYLADMLKENCYIGHLNLAENRLGSIGAVALCDMLLHNTSLVSINLSGNGFQDKDAPYFATALLENSRVRELDLSHNNFGDASGDCLGHAIGENEILERLDLSWNHFRGPAGIAIVDGVKVNSRLKRVNLAWNGLGDEACVAIADCLKNNNVLLDLDIANNRITLQGTLIIAKGLDANETLRVFKMGHNTVGSAGAQVILDAVNNERSVLTELDLSHICVEKGFESLVQDMKQSREISVHHGGVVGDFVIRGSQKDKNTGDEDDLNADELAALRALDDFLKNDPMAVLNAHVRQKNLRLLDLFKQFDRDNNFLVTASEFKQGVKSANIGLEDKQLDNLLDRLDRGKDGRIDYSRLVFGTLRMKMKERRLSQVVITQFERRGSVLTGAGLERATPFLQRNSLVETALKHYIPHH